MNFKFNCSLPVTVWGWVSVNVMVEAEFGTSSAFRGWLRVFGYGFGVRGRKVQSRDCRVRGAGVSQNRDRSKSRSVARSQGKVCR